MSLLRPALVYKHYQQWCYNVPVTLPIVSYESLALLQPWFVENVKHHVYKNMMCYINFTEI